MARKIQKRRKDVTFKITERDRNDGSLRPGSESNVAEPDSSTRVGLSVEKRRCSLTVGFGDTLQLVLLLDGVAVGGSLGSVNQLVSKTFSDGLDVPEGGLASASDEEPDSLVHAAERRYVHGLTTNSSCTTDTGRVLTRPAVDDSVSDDLQRVLTRQQMDDFEGVLNDADRHQLLAVVSSVHHQGIRQTLHDGALSLSEPLRGISASGVGQILGELFLDGDVIRQTDVVDHHVIRAPLVEQLDLRQFWSFNLDGCLSDGDLFFPIFRHFWIQKVSFLTRNRSKIFKQIETTQL